MFNSKTSVLLLLILALFPTSAHILQDGDTIGVASTDYHATSLFTTLSLAVGYGIGFLSKKFKSSPRKKSVKTVKQITSIVRYKEYKNAALELEMSRHSVNGTFEKSFRLQHRFGKFWAQACHIIENKSYIVRFIPLDHLRDKAHLRRKIEEVRGDPSTGYVTSWIETINNKTGVFLQFEMPKEMSGQAIQFSGLKALTN